MISQSLNKKTYTNLLYNSVLIFVNTTATLVNKATQGIFPLIKYINYTTLDCYQIITIFGVLIKKPIKILTNKNIL